MRLASLDISLRSQGGAAFNPATTAPDLWYSASDMAANFQLSGGTTAAAVDSPIGYIGDKPDFIANATQATAGLRPILRQVGAVKTIDFDGADDTMTAPALSNYATASAYYFVASGVFPTASADAVNAFSDDVLFYTDDSQLGFGVRSSNQIILSSYDGVYQSINAAYTVGQPYVAEGWLTGGVLNLRVNKGAPVTLACGNLTALTGNLKFATYNGAFYADCKLGELLFYKTVPAAGVRDQLATYAAAQVGLAV